MDLSEVRAASARHPWETARAAAIERVLREAKLQPSAVLDHGCGDGFTGERVSSVLGALSLTGFDIHLTAEQCARRSVGNVTYTNDWERTPVAAFDLCLLCDVIEHVEDDRALLEQVGTRLSATGHVLLTVPAFQAVFSHHDQALRHFRRYSLGQLQSVARAAGLEPIASGYLFASLLALRCVSKVTETLRPKVPSEDFGIGAWRGSNSLTRVLETALNLDNSLLLSLASRGIRLPGLSAWALCRKQSS